MIAFTGVPFGRVAYTGHVSFHDPPFMHSSSQPRPTYLGAVSDNLDGLGKWADGRQMHWELEIVFHGSRRMKKGTRTREVWGNASHSGN